MDGLSKMVFITPTFQIVLDVKSNYSLLTFCIMKNKEMISGHIYIARQGDREHILERREYYRSYSKDELINRYNEACAKGFFGSHGQALELIALWMVFRERFGDSPIIITDNVLIEFSGLILATGNGWIHLDKLGTMIEN